MTAAYRHELKYLITDAVCHELSVSWQASCLTIPTRDPQAFTESEACTLTIFTAPPTVKNWTEWKSAKIPDSDLQLQRPDDFPGMQAQKRRVYL